MELRFSRAIVPSVVAVFLLPILAGVVSADGMAGNGGMGMSGGSDMGGHMWKDGMGYTDGSGEQIREMMQAGMKHSMFAELTYEDGIADGYYISFLLNETSGAVTNYSLKTAGGAVTIFDSIEIAGFDPSAPEVHGAVMLFDNETVQVIIHDNPTGMYHVIANSTEAAVSFKIAAGIDVTDISPGNGDGLVGNRQAVMITDGEVEAIVTTDDGTLVVDRGSAGTYVNVTFENDHAMFRAKPAFAYRNVHNESAMQQALIQKRLACEMSLVVRNGSAMFDVMEYQNQFRMTVMTAEQNRIVVQVSSENHEGRVVLMNMDQLTLETRKGLLTVEIDGKKVRESSNPLEVLYATGSEEEDAVYTVLQSDDISQVLVYVPSFSTHTITIESVLPGAEIFGIAGVVAVLGAVAIVSVAAFALFAKKK